LSIFNDVYDNKEDADAVIEAKRLVKENVCYTVCDSPTPAHIGNSAENTAFLERKAEESIENATELLEAVGYTEEQIEDAIGCDGYQTAMDWAESDTYLLVPPPTWRSRVKKLIQAHENEAAELVD